MGQKVNPINFRLQVHKNWSSRWFTANKKEFAEAIRQDHEIRELIEKKFASRPTINRIEIERSARGPAAGGRRRRGKRSAAWGFRYGSVPSCSGSWRLIPSFQIFSNPLMSKIRNTIKVNHTPYPEKFPHGHPPRYNENNRIMK